MKTILVVREFDVFSRILAADGYEVVNLPLIETSALDDLNEFENKLAIIENYDGIFLTSAKAGEIFRAKLNEKGKTFSGKVYVLGKRSSEILKNENLDLVRFDSANTAREMLEKIALDDLKGKRFLFVRGEKSLRVIPDFLSKIAAVDETIVYRTKNVAVTIDELNRWRERIENGEIAAACFFSPSAAAIFIEQFGTQITHQTIIAAIGKTTAEFFEQRNALVGFVSSKATAEDFAVELINFLNQNDLRNISENDNKETVIIGKHEIEGFIDDEAFCPNCSENKIYYDDYDAFFCPKCNLWLDSACSDPNCGFCRARPKIPLT